MNLGLLPSTLIDRRRIARGLLADDDKPVDVARKVRVSVQTIYRWSKMSESMAETVRPAGRRSKLASEDDKKVLNGILDLWDAKDLKTLQAEILGALKVTYSLSQISRMIRGRSIRTPQMPETIRKQITAMLSKPPKKTVIQTAKGATRLSGDKWTIESAQKVIKLCWKLDLTERCLDQWIKGSRVSPPARRISEVKSKTYRAR